MLAAGAWERNDGEAIKWYRRAANHGYPDGERRLGDMYAEGRGVEQSDAEASRWWSEAEESSEYCEQSEVIVVRFAPYEDEAEWDAYVVSRDRREWAGATGTAIHGGDSVPDRANVSCMNVEPLRLECQPKGIEQLERIEPRKRRRQIRQRLDAPRIEPRPAGGCRQEGGTATRCTPIVQPVSSAPRILSHIFYELWESQIMIFRISHRSQAYP